MQAQHLFKLYSAALLINGLLLSFRLLFILSEVAQFSLFICMTAFIFAVSLSFDSHFVLFHLLF